MRASLTLPRNAAVTRSAAGAALAALVRSQMLAARSTALFRNHDAVAKYPVGESRSCALVPVHFTSRIASFDPQDVTGVLVATIYSLDEPADENFVRFFEQKVVPTLRKAGVDPVAQFVTRKSANDFPGLPLGDSEHAFVWFAVFDDEHAFRKSAAALAASPNWSEWISVDLRHRLASDPQTVRLAPSPRSALYA